MGTKFFDEMYDATRTLRPHYRAYADWLAATPEERIARKRAEAEAAAKQSAQLAAEQPKTDTSVFKAD